MKKLLLLILFSGLFSKVNAELAVTLNVETPGTLSTMIASSRVPEVTHLTLSGSINDQDVYFIRGMAGGTYKGRKYSGCALEYLDIANTTIVESKSYHSGYGNGYACQHTKYRGQDYYEEQISYGTKSNTITPYMFDNCYKLKTVILPKNITKMEINAFFETNIVSITLPDNLETIECTFPSWNITDIKISDSNQNFKIIDGVLYSFDMKKLYRCPVNYGTPIFQIPEGVENIGDLAFNYCQAIKEFVTPSTLKKIGNKAFGWMSLDKLVLDPRVNYSSIGDFTNIKEVIIPESYTEFDPSLFGSTNYDYAEWGGTKVNNVKVFNTTPPTLTGNFNRAILAGNLYVPKGSYSTYYIAYRWGDFSHIYEMDDEGSDRKCAIPSITYSNGSLSFICETEGVTFKSTIANSDISSYNSDKVQLAVTYNISVYATKTGYENSEVATATLCWIDVEPKMDGINNSIAQVKANPVLIQANNGKITIAGADDGTKVTAYGANGQQVGFAISKGAKTSIHTNLPSGSIAIVKIGDKSVKVVVK